VTRLFTNTIKKPKKKGGGKGGNLKKKEKVGPFTGVAEQLLVQQGQHRQKDRSERKNRGGGDWTKGASPRGPKKFAGA